MDICYTNKITEPYYQTCYNNTYNNSLQMKTPFQITNSFQTPSELGFAFENLIHNEISQCGYQVLREKDIINKYGPIAFGIDHLIIGPNFIVSIQDKWKITKPQINDINHFIMASTRVGQIENKKCLGIYLSKAPLTTYAKSAFEHDNKIQQNKYIDIYSDNQTQIIKKLTKILYIYGIYFFEPDGSVIMLNNHC
jgi:hypothetical protein